MARTSKPHNCPGCGATGIISKSYWNRNGNKSSQLIFAATGQPHTGPGSDGRCSGHRRGQQERKPMIDTPTTETGLPEGDKLAHYLAQVLGPLMKLQGAVNMDEVKAIVQAELTNRPPQKIIIQQPDLPDFDATDEHKQFAELMLKSSVRSRNGYTKPLWIKGPAGSFKTTAVEHLCKAKGLDFRFQSCSDQMTTFDVFGFTDAQGRTVRTDFREVYEHGGGFLFDEVDKGNANTCSAMQMAIENGWCAFPDGKVQRHKDCHLFAAGNTFGTGADAIYVGSNQLDGAFLDRFGQLDWSYDEDLERKLSNHDKWVDHVIRLRHKAEQLKMRVVISPRASMNGADWLRAGVSWPECEDAWIYRGLDATQRANLAKQ